MFMLHKPLQKIFVLVAFVVLGFAAPAQRSAAAPEKTRVLLILDCSHSMWDKWQSDAKIKVTQKVLLSFLDSIRGQSDMEVALRVFGHLNKDAFGTRLEVPFEADNNYKLQSKIKTLVPNGGCTAATALTNSLNDFPHDDNARNIILIITDGMDDCDGNICDVARQVQLSGIIVKTFIIGIGNPNDFQHRLDCAGRFSYLHDEELFDETLYEVFYLSDQKSRVTLSVLDNDKRLYETEVPVAFYDRQTHVVKYATIYHYDTEDDIDTLTIDPLVNYDITFFTKPPIQLENQQFKSGRHTDVAITAPQGSLRLRHENKRVPFQVPAYSMLVRQHGDPTVLANQPLGSKMDYIAGNYDLEVLSLPGMRLNNITVRPGSATDLQIPMPGQLALDKPKTITTGSLFAYVEGVLQWVCDLNPNSVSERIVLMPGEYQVILKPQEASDYVSVRTARFTIETGKQTGVTLE